MTQGTGWGGNGPYGHDPYDNGPYGYAGWTPPPQPPKPGVIPLGPLSTSDILTGTFATMGRYWKQLFGLAAMAYGAAALVLAAAAWTAYAAVGDHLSRVIDPAGNADPSWDDIRPPLIAFGCLWLVGMLTLLAASTLVQAACPAIAQEAVLGRPTTIGAVWRRASARVPAVLGTVVLSALIGFVPAALFVLGFGGALVTYLTLGDASWAAWLIPLGFLGLLVLGPLAVWLWVRFSLAPSIAVIESQGPVASLRRSVALVRGAWWRIFATSLLAALMAGLAGSVIQQVLSLTAGFPGMIDTSALADDPTAGQVVAAVSGFLLLITFGQLISQIFSATFPPLVLNLLYVDQRIRKENLAPTLAEAAAARPA